MEIMKISIDLLLIIHLHWIPFIISNIITIKFSQLSTTFVQQHLPKLLFLFVVELDNSILRFSIAEHVILRFSIASSTSPKIIFWPIENLRIWLDRARQLVFRTCCWVNVVIKSVKNEIDKITWYIGPWNDTAWFKSLLLFGFPLTIISEFSSSLHNFSASPDANIWFNKLLFGPIRLDPCIFCANGAFFLINWINSSRGVNFFCFSKNCLSWSSIFPVVA